jgi:hypothetical protein
MKLTVAALVSALNRTPITKSSHRSPPASCKVRGRLELEFHHDLAAIAALTKERDGIAKFRECKDFGNRWPESMLVPVRTNASKSFQLPAVAV